MAKPFANFQRYGEAWEVIDELTPGGQGAAFKARSSKDTKEAFLKVLSRQTDVERRARFFREATAYSTHRHAGLPTLIESNAQHHGDLKYKLYLATEFIEGPTLSQFISEHASVSLQHALDIALPLLGTVEFLHKAGWIHRDIKPDNIILRNGNLSDAVLLDFGLGYSEAAASDHSTEASQEIGNRFVRLPELSANSSLKRDARTDVTFTIAIFFFALTGVTPSVLLDANQRLPHQRDEIPRLLLEKAGQRAKCPSRKKLSRVNHL